LLNRSRLDFPSVFGGLSPEDVPRLGASEPKMDRGLKRKGFAVIDVLLFCTMAMQAHAATITVINTNDSGPGSLRQALANANNGDRINFAVTGTITLTSGGLGITKNVTISGPGANRLSINGTSGGVDLLAIGGRS